LEPPRRVDAIAALPNHPPVAFTWRHHRHRVCRAEGPERIHGEWWFKDRERQSVRDYFRVEDENGQRFWLFREGNGVDACTGDLSWYLHGLF
jgi:protein ImuB